MNTLLVDSGKGLVNRDQTGRSLNSVLSCEMFLGITIKTRDLKITGQNLLLSSADSIFFLYKSSYKTSFINDILIKVKLFKIMFSTSFFVSLT